MRSLREAALLLSAADSLDSLGTIAAALGFGSDALPLDRDAWIALGIEEELAEARIASGGGALRALIVRLAPHGQPRDQLSRIAARLSARAPQLLWLVLGVGYDRQSVVLATWSAARGRPRVAALAIDRARVVASDAETVNAMAAAASAADVLTHARWLDLLGRDALTRRFFRTLERIVATLGGSLDAPAALHASADDRGELALLVVSRLLFLSFLETKGWLDGDAGFLERTFARCMLAGGGYHRRVLDPLFFGTLNTPRQCRAPSARAFGRVPFLNGGLFARTPLERRLRGARFPDESLGSVFGDLLSRYRFTAHESDGAWSEAAVDPEMLGKAFESLMASRVRRATGAFYTPQPIVERVTEGALATAFGDADSATRALAGEPVTDPVASRALRASIGGIRLIDPACGSGAFLVFALERLATIAALAGDDRPVAVVRRELLARSIFGVDVNPTAVWLCELRLWLSVVIESDADDPLAVPPLPNLDHHICAGDSLAGQPWLESRDGGAPSLGPLRERYARASGARKRTLQRQLDRAERTLAIRQADAALAVALSKRRDLVSALRGRDLFGARGTITAEHRAALAGAKRLVRERRACLRALAGGGALPFSFATRFGDVGARGGFDVVIGNPPWVRLHRIPKGIRADLRARFDVYSRAQWTAGARGARAGAGFAAQVDLASLFIERGVRLAREGGAIALLVPAKLWHSLAAGGVRRLLAADTEILALEDWSESATAFDAAVYPATLIARRLRRGSASGGAVSAVFHHRATPLAWTIARESLSLDAADPASPWLVIPPAVRAAWNRARASGGALGDSQFGAPLLGVKCGCNDAFIVRLCTCDGAIASVRANERRGTIERDLLRPLLRGEAISPWRARESGDLVVWTHDIVRDVALHALPPLAAAWLAPWRRRLAARSDARSGKWWSLFRTASARTGQTRVVWADVGRAPRALVLEQDDPTVPLNSCYVVPCGDRRDAFALSAILNSALAAAWLGVIAEPARGGYRRYLGWTVALLPIPQNWCLARDTLAPIAERAQSDGSFDKDELLDAVLAAYSLRMRDVAPLLAWNGR
ncbi:MAG: DNA methyltransferase [Gemmatimonadaceae bacterium]